MTRTESLSRSVACAEPHVRSRVLDGALRRGRGARGGGLRTPRRALLYVLAHGLVRIVHEAPRSLESLIFLTTNLVTGGDSDSPDEATVKCTAWPEASIPARADSSDTESSSSIDDDSDLQDFEARSGDGDYRTLTPRRLDNSTRRDDAFKWMPSENMSDVVEPTSIESRTEEQASGSLDRRRRAPADRNDRDRKTRSSLSTKPPQHPSSIRASPRPRRPRVEETPPELQRRWNSYEHFRWPGPEGGWWPPMCWCHGPPAPPPCYMHDRSWPSHPSLPPVPSRSYKV